MRIILRKSFFLTAAFFIFLFVSCQPLHNRKGPVRIGFSYSGRQSEPYHSNNLSIIENFSDDPRYDLSEFSANGDLTEQIIGIYNIMSRGVDFMIIDPVSEHGLENAIENLSLKKIPVILTCGTVRHDPSENCSIIHEVYCDYYNEAKSAVECLELYEKGKSNVNICVFNDVADTTSARERMRALNEGVEKNKGWNIISRRETNGEYDKAKFLMNELYENQEVIDAVFVESEKNYLGVIDILFKYGKMPGEDVYIFVFEETPQIRRMVNSNIVNFAVQCSKENGVLIRELIEKINKGRSFVGKDITESTFLYSNKAVDEAMRSRQNQFFSSIF